MALSGVIIGIDVGTSAIKGGVFSSENFECLGAWSVPHKIFSPHPTWCEANPEDWWEAIKAIIGKALNSAKSGHHEVVALSISTLVPCFIPVDKSGVPLRPAILWSDRRTEEECAWIATYIGVEKCFETSGNTVNHYFWGPKVLWFKNKEFHLLRETWKILHAQSYIVYKLTGEIVTDYSSAGLSAPFYDYKLRAWSGDMCERMGIPSRLLPRIEASSKVVGGVTEKAARELGVKKGVPVVAGCGDFAASMVGVGAIDEGDFCIMLGTAGNFLIPMNVPLFDPRMINSSHAIEGKYVSFGTSYAGGSLQWFTKLFDNPSYRDLDEEASLVSPGSDGLVFLPYLMGELTLGWDWKARGVFFGLSLKHTRAHLYRSILESISYRLKSFLEIVRSRGVKVNRVLLVNGGGKSPVWRQILSEILGLPLLYVESLGAPLGDAFIAALSLRIAKEEDIKKKIVIKSETVPHPDNIKVYENYFEFYKEIDNWAREKYAVRTKLSLA